MTLNDTAFIVFGVCVLLWLRALVISRAWRKAREAIGAFNQQRISRSDGPLLPYPGEAVFPTFSRFILACLDLRKWNRRQLFPYAVEAFDREP